MRELYAENGKIKCYNYTELYIPKSYFEDNFAINRGATIESLGVLYYKSWQDGKEGELMLLNMPVMTEFMVYETKDTSITVKGKTIDVLALEYLPDSYIVHQTIPRGRDVAAKFLESVLAGKLPNTLDYAKLMDMWWTNLSVAGISYKVPSKIYEMILATIYRDPNNMKKRYGQYYGRRTEPDGYSYQTGNVRNIVKNLSTFSGMVYEDIGTMISQGINNSSEGVEEPVSPLEKIIYM